MLYLAQCACHKARDRESSFSRNLAADWVTGAFQNVALPLRSFWSPRPGLINCKLDLQSTVQVF